MRWSVLYEQRTGRQAESECVLRVISGRVMYTNKEDA